jgi:hypothetical protein
MNRRIDLNRAALWNDGFHLLMHSGRRTGWAMLASFPGGAQGGKPAAFIVATNF